MAEKRAAKGVCTALTALTTIEGRSIMAEANKHAPACEIKPRVPLTQDRLKELLHYDPETGKFVWVGRFSFASRVIIGSFAGTVHPTNCGTYIRIEIGGKSYYAHQLAYLFMTGSFIGILDHRDGDGLNNSWENLRPTNAKLNCANAKIRRDNSSGFKGVTWDKRSRKWHARIGGGVNRKSLGYFSAAEDARKAYVTAAKNAYGDFARTE